MSAGSGDEFGGPPPADDLERTREFDFGDRPERGGRRAGRRAERRRRADRGAAVHDAPRHVPSRARPRRPAWQRLLLAAGLLVLLVCGSALAMRAIYSGKAMPGTQIGEEDVSGMSEAELRRTVERLGDPERQLNLTGAGKTLKVTAGGAGLSADAGATVDEALAAHRGGFFAPFGALIHTEQVPLDATVDPAALRDTVEQVAKAIDRDPYAGGLSIDDETLEVTVVPAKAGRTVRQQELTDALRARLLHPGPTVVRVPLSTGTPVSEERLDALASDADDYLRRPLVLSGAGKDYTVSQAKLANLLAVEPLKGGSSARLGVDTAVLSDITKAVADSRDRSARSASISAPSSGPTLDGKGEVTWRPKSAKVTVRAEGRTGLDVDVKGLNTKIREAVRAGSHSAKVPTKVTQPPVNKSTAEKIDQVIGTFTTYHPPGQPRVTNIHRMAETVDGTIVAPGEEFSLNGVVGERTKAKGYVEAPFIAGNKIEPSVGGGVSQFSTTMYNAAYFAGLPILASQAHSLYIDRYPAGRETTLNWPGIDLRWKNDTGTPILVRTSYTDTSITVTLYGHNGGRRVQAVPGDRQPNPGGNFTVTVTRKIRYSDGREVEQPRTTSYANEVTDGEPQE